MFYIASIMIVNMHKLACVKNHHVFFFFLQRTLNGYRSYKTDNYKWVKHKKKKKGQIFWNKKLCCSQDLIKDLHLLN